MSGEAQLKAEIRLALGKVGHARLFNNPMGQAWVGHLVARDQNTIKLASPRRVKYGLALGSADLCGWTSLIITPEMVGSRVAVFTSGEVKPPGVPPPREDQNNWCVAVHDAGGFSAILRSVNDALRLVRA